MRRGSFDHAPAAGAVEQRRPRADRFGFFLDRWKTREVGDVADIDPLLPRAVVHGDVVQADVETDLAERPRGAEVDADAAALVAVLEIVAQRVFDIVRVGRTVPQAAAGERRCEQGGRQQHRRPEDVRPHRIPGALW